MKNKTNYNAVRKINAQITALESVKFDTDCKETIGKIDREIKILEFAKKMHFRAWQMVKFMV